MPLEAAFVRMSPGEWFCRAPVAIDGPSGLVSATPGVVYRRGKLLSGVDVAALLDDWHATGKVPPNIKVFPA
jgi:hypothetical protein